MRDRRPEAPRPFRLHETTLGILLLTSFFLSLSALTAALIDRYGWLVGLLVSWSLGPLVGAAGSLLIYLWLLPVIEPASGSRRQRRRTVLPDAVRSAVFGRAPSISVVVPVLNGESYLRQSLPPLEALLRSGELLEVLVVDDGCTDKSAEMALAAGATVLRTSGRLGPGAARNLAAEHARGDILWFVDADVVVYGSGSSRLRKAFSDLRVVAVFGSYDDRPPAQNFGSQYKNLLHHFHHQNCGDSASTFWSGCGAVWRETFLRLGGFDTTRYARPSIEDVELGYRLCRDGGLIRIDRELLSTHLKRWSIPEIIRTDVVQRALPWSRLIFENNSVIDELNVNRAERLRAALAATLLLTAAAAGVALAPGWALLPLALTAATTNWALFQVFRRGRGLTFACTALIFHQLYYVYSTLIFIYAWFESKRFARGKLHLSRVLRRG